MLNSQLQSIVGASLLVISGIAGAATAWDEGINGDISGYPATPTVIALGLGENLVTAETSGAGVVE